MRSSAMAVVAGLLLASPLQAQMQVNNADIWLGPGHLVETFVVTNGGTETQQFTLEDADWDRSDDGTNRFFRPGTTPSSCERALEVFPRQMRIQAGGSQTVRVSLRPDSLPSRACWSLVFVQSEPGATPQTTVGVRYITRIGVKIYYTPAETVTLAEVVDFAQAAKRTPADTAAVVLTVRNTGTKPIFAGGTVEIRRADNFVVAKVPVEAVPLLPTATRAIRVTLPNLMPGSYVALAVFDYGADEDLAAQTPIVIQ